MSEKSKKEMFMESLSKMEKVYTALKVAGISVDDLMETFPFFVTYWFDTDDEEEFERNINKSEKIIFDLVKEIHRVMVEWRKKNGVIKR